VETNAGQAIEQLIEQYGKLVFHVIFGLTSNWLESQDLTQETFLLAFRHIDAARTASGSGFQAKAWLLRIAVNLVRKQYRRQRSLHFLTFSELQHEQSPLAYAQELPPPAYEEIQSAGDLETIIAERDTVQRCMQQLPETLRIPLLLSIVVGFSPHELTGMLGLKEATVRQRLSRARKAFQHLYAYECGEHIHLAEIPVARARRPGARVHDHTLRRSIALAPAAAL
jgi:RNA polymerase sigma-70 factor (ECF subfamily)